MRKHVIKLLLAASFVFLGAGLVVNMMNAGNVRITESELSNIHFAFEEYFKVVNDYPPFSKDHCSACSDALRSSWLVIVKDVEGVTQKKISERDSWGEYFAYDKNFRQPGWNSWSVLCSAGPNRVLETNFSQNQGKLDGDDICIFFPDSD